MVRSLRVRYERSNLSVGYVTFYETASFLAVTVGVVFFSFIDCSVSCVLVCAFIFLRSFLFVDIHCLRHLEFFLRNSCTYMRC